MSGRRSSWSAVAERSDDTALESVENNEAIARAKAAWYFVSRRSP